MCSLRRGRPHLPGHSGPGVRTSAAGAGGRHGLRDASASSCPAWPAAAAAGPRGGGAPTRRGGTGASQGRAGVSPRGPPGRRVAAPGPRDPPSLSAERPAASGLRSQGPAPCRGTGATPPRTRSPALTGLFTRSRRSEGTQGAAWGAFVPLCLFAGTFSSEGSTPHPVPLESLVVSLEVGRRLRRVRRLLVAVPPDPRL